MAVKLNQHNNTSHDGANLNTHKISASFSNGKSPKKKHQNLNLWWESGYS